MTGMDIKMVSFVWVENRRRKSKMISNTERLITETTQEGNSQK